MEVLRAGLLGDVGVVVASAAAGGMGAAVAMRCRALGAAVVLLEIDPTGEEPACAAPCDVLVWDGGSPASALDGAWPAIRAAALPQMLTRGGLIVLVAPPPGDAAAAGARAGLEALARTLSIEWARYGVRPLAIRPGAATSPVVVAELIAYLASPAGAYFSGCVVELDAVA